MLKLVCENLSIIINVLKIEKECRSLLLNTYFNTSRLQTSHFRLQTHRRTLQLIPFARSSKRWVIAGLSLPFTATPSANDLGYFTYIPTLCHPR